MADDNRSLSSGMSLPQWMKTRMNDRLNLDQTALSPPDNDDSFLIRYKRISPASNTTSNNGQSTPKIEVVPTAPSTVGLSNNTATDFSKHTGPCKQFIPNSVNVLSEAVKPIAGKLKSTGTDDGFKGEAAQCGSSVIRVAHQMVSAKFSKDFTIHEEEIATEPPGFNRNMRRGSKSLPSSPLSSPSSSPKSRRRHVNRYFASGTDAEKIQGSWILSGLLKKQSRLSHSVSVISEEESAHNDALTKSISQISLDEMPEITKKVPTQKLKAKPSELREMNFWSPTSM